MLQLTHKELKTLGKDCEGFYFTGDIYDYENKLHYISCICHNPDEVLSYANRQNDKYLKMIETILKFNPTGITTKQIAYSHGIYGNTGQFHKHTFYNSEGNTLTLFTYV